MTAEWKDTENMPSRFIPMPKIIQREDDKFRLKIRIGLIKTHLGILTND